MLQEEAAVNGACGGSGICPIAGLLGNKCFTLYVRLGLGLAQPSEACSQPEVAGRGMWQVSRGCLVCLYRRVTLTSDSIL